MTQRDKLLAKICGKTTCVCCIICTQLSKTHKEIDWPSRHVTPSGWGNVVLLNVPDRWLSYPASICRIPLPHFWNAETHGLTQMTEKGICTLADVRARTRREISEIVGVGEKAMEELDRIMKQCHVFYKEEDDRLFPDSPDEFPSEKF